MEYTRLGPSGLRVSRIALGCMGFGDPGVGASSWTLDDTAAAPIFRRAVDLGITLWDTANVLKAADLRSNERSMPLPAARVALTRRSAHP